MRLHAVVAVVGAQLQELGQVAMPGVQVHGHGALAHTELVHGHGGVVDNADPPDHAAGHTLEAADAAARCAHLSQVHAHAATVLGHLGKVVDAAVDADERIGHGVDEAARQLVIGLAGVAHGGRGHGDLEAAQHVVKPLDPRKALGALLVHGQMQGDTQKHLLRALERLTRMAADHVALQEQVEAGVGEQVVARGINAGGRLLQLLGRIGVEDIGAVEPLVCEIGHELGERLDA